MMNNYTNTVSLGAMMVRPIDPSSKLSHEALGDGLFDDRHDFLIYEKMTHLAVMLTLMNDSVLTPNPMELKKRVTVTLLDMSTNVIVRQRNVSITMSADLLVTNLRADIPFTPADVDCSHAYKVMVQVNRYAPPLGEHVMHFYRMSELRVLPTKWFTAVSGYVDDEYISGNHALRNPGCADLSDAAVTFMMLCNLGPKAKFIPELGLRVVYPNGREVTDLVTPRQLENGRWCVALPFSVNDCRRGVYYAELRCMGYAFAGFLFSTEGEPEEGEWQTDGLERIPEYTPHRGAHFFKIRNGQCQTPTAELPSVHAGEIVCAERVKLDNLTGLTSVKRKLVEYDCLMRFSRMRADAGLPMMPVSLHSMFLGSPGTGKTTVAKIMGGLLHRAGVLSKGHVVVRERATLVGRYYNSESENVKNALEEAQGGILFIDEAYQLYQPEDAKDPGRFVIDSLLTALSDESNRDWMLILAGYSEPMMRLFEINPGLRSRIPESNIYTFDDFSEGELMEIAERYFQNNNFTLTDNARQALERVLGLDYANRTKEFGNARHVINLIQTRILPNMAMRLATVQSPTADDLSRIMSADIPQPSAPVRMARPTIGFRPLPRVS